MSTASNAATSPFDRLPDELIETIARCVMAANRDDKPGRLGYCTRDCSAMTCLDQRWNRIVSPLMWRSITVRAPDEGDTPEPSEVGDMLNTHTAQIRKLRVECEDPTDRQTTWLLSLFEVAEDVCFTHLTIKYEDFETAMDDSVETYERIESIADRIAAEVEVLPCHLRCFSGRPEYCYDLVKRSIQQMPYLRRLTVKMDRYSPEDKDGDEDEDPGLQAYRSLFRCAEARRPPGEYLEVDD